MSSTATTVAEAVGEDGLSPPTRTLLFGPLAATDVSSAVVHRLRAAIGLGLLPDGKRLPKEADLAEQLGITTFALREALADLRRQGLLVTKAGKYGGSFVMYPVQSEQLEHDELLHLSSADLRDLGDWRQMLSGHAASLAAQRASESTVARLRTYAMRVRDATSSVEARRAHGRFHLELASASQSMRMTRAEFGVHEQIDWLFGLALQTEHERTASARALDEIAAAVSDRDPKRARASAESHISRIINRLGQLRIEGLAARQSTSSAGGDSLAVEIRERIRVLVSELQTMADEVAPALAGDLGFQQLRSRISVAGLQRFDFLPPFTQGAGIVVEVGVIPEHPYWIQWWRRTDSGPLAENHHVLDPEREDFYDYERMELMSKPRETGRPWAYGPYVDYGGVDNYILSVTAPILHQGRFLGVSCVDLLVADLESWLSPYLADAPASFLLNHENRVIVSNSIRCSVGDFLTDRRGYDVVELDAFGWSLLTLRSDVADGHLKGAYHRPINRSAPVANGARSTF